MGGLRVPWEAGEKAYAQYRAQCGDSQSIEKIARRGGFGLKEFCLLYRAMPPTAYMHECDVSRTLAEALGQLKSGDEL